MEENEECVTSESRKKANFLRTGGGEVPENRRLRISTSRSLADENDETSPDAIRVTFFRVVWDVLFYGGATDVA